jgi:hypothetical protein
LYLLSWHHLYILRTRWLKKPYKWVTTQWRIQGRNLFYFLSWRDVFFYKKKCKNKIWFSKQGFISGEKNILPNNNISLSPVSLYNENCLPFWRIVERLYPLWSILSLSITNSPFIYNIRSCFYLLLSRTKQCQKLLLVKEKIMSTSSLGIFMWFFKNIT